MLAVSNSVFLNQATDKIAAVLPGAPQQEVLNAVGGVDNSFLTGLSLDLRSVVVEQVFEAFRVIWYIPISAGAVVAILSTFMKRGRLGAD